MAASRVQQPILRWGLLLLLIPLVTACAIQRTSTPYKIALLAPFEGRYRDVGYDALYAARLALSEANLSQIVLALGVPSRLPRSAQRRQDQRCQHADDGDHHQQLNQSKPASKFRSHL